LNIVDADNTMRTAAQVRGAITLYGCSSYAQ